MQTIDPIPSAGFIFNFQGANFDPDGKIQAELSADETKRHNAALAAGVVAHMKASGCAVLYLFKSADKPREGETQVGTWEGSHKFQITDSKRSFHNMAGRHGRLDVWFNFDGSRWHGVNIGDNDICRCRRTKEKA